MQYGFKDESLISSENLKILTESGCLIYEERICELALMAQKATLYVKELTDGDLSIFDAITALREEGDVFFDQSPQTSASITREHVDVFSRELSYLDKILFAKLLCDALARYGIVVHESDLLPMRRTGELFTYVRNVLSDEAYDVFSQEFDDPRITYSTTTRDALRSVADGECDYCIVPFEEKGGARVTGIYAMIASFDLKVVAVTPIFGPDGDADVKYALVGREFSALDRQDGDDIYIDLAIPTESSFTVSDLLLASERMGLTVYRIGSLDVGNGSGRVSLVFAALRSSGKEIVPLLTFLEMFADDYTAIGLYKNIE